jgi:hypothetical protein
MPPNVKASGNVTMEGKVGKTATKEVNHNKKRKENV